MKKVLFVCLGNICRSPLGAAIFNHKMQETDWQADSAGTAAYHIGKNPDCRSIQIAQSHGVPIAHKARKFVKADLDRFDFILAMDQDNLSNIIQTIGQSSKKVHLLRSFDFKLESGLNVPDPYYGGIDDFEEVFQMLSCAIDGLINHLKDYDKW